MPSVDSIKTVQVNGSLKYINIRIIKQILDGGLVEEKDLPSHIRQQIKETSSEAQK